MKETFYPICLIYLFGWIYFAEEQIFYYHNLKRWDLRSFPHAINGIITLIKSEHNARIHLVATLSATILGFLLKINTAEWISIVIVIGLVILTELFNTAIERLADLVEPTRNDLIGQIKDYSAGAVLIAAIVSLIVGGLIFIPKILDLLS